MTRLSHVAIAASTVALIVSLAACSSHARRSGTTAPSVPAATGPIARTSASTSNPIDVPWWADGVLHLARTDLPVPNVASLVEIGRGASYAAAWIGAAGRVYFSDSCGSISAIGRAGSSRRLAAARDGTLVAWVDPQHGHPAVVAWDAATRREVGRVRAPTSGDFARLPGGPYPVAIASGLVFYVSDTGSHRWRPGHPAALVSGPTGRPLSDNSTRVADAVGAVVSFAEDFERLSSSVAWRPTPHGRAPARPGAGGSLTSDHRHVLVEDSDRTGRWRAYDLRSGVGTRLALPTADIVTMPATGPGAEAVFVVGRDNPSPLPSGTANDGPVPVSFDLVSCRADTGSCSTVAHDVAHGSSLSVDVVLPD